MQCTLEIVFLRQVCVNMQLQILQEMLVGKLFLEYHRHMSHWMMDHLIVSQEVL